MPQILCLVTISHVLKMPNNTKNLQMHQYLIAHLIKLYSSPMKLH